MKKIFIAWFPSVALMVIIFLLSSRQSINISDEFVINFSFFKTLHVLEFFALTIFNFHGFTLTTKFKIHQKVVLSILCSLAFSVSDELHQMYVPTRQGSFRDIGIDLIGISLASGLILAYFKRIEPIYKRIIKTVC